MTNLYQTECWAEHLTQFASGLSFLPEPIRWENVFRNTDFNRNRTIYLTVIIVFLFYIVLMIYARYYDRKDLNKVVLNERETRQSSSVRFSLSFQCSMWPMIDNQRDDRYFYQVLVLTGRRAEAGTRSQVSRAETERRPDDQSCSI